MNYFLTQTSKAPLVLTLELEKPVQEWAQSLRDRHFPRERNVVPAHITLFHALPADYETPILAHLAEPRSIPLVRIEAPFLLGGGVAYRVASPEVKTLRDQLSGLVPVERCTKQDHAPWCPHLTIQNKVPPEHARALQESLLRTYEPIKTFGAALRLWRYLGGPWKLITRLPFLVTE